MLDEEWKPAPVIGYEVSNLGRVRSLGRSHTTKNRHGVMVRRRKGRVLKPAVDKDGYLFVGLYHKGRKYGFRVSRMVLWVFVGAPLPNEEALHKDHDKANNRLDNLRWGSRLENEADKTKSGRRPESTRKLLTFEDANTIRDLYKTGKYTQAQIGEMFGCHHSNISLIVRQVIWRN